MNTTHRYFPDAGTARFAPRRFVLACGIAAVAALPWMSTAPVMAQSMPPMQTYGSIEYVSGGIGKDEVDALKRAEAGFPLTLEFAASAEKPTADATEPFVANADVNIQDSSGREVLNVRTDGPLLLLKLPSGRYTVDAHWNGVRKRHSVAVSDDKRQHVMFDFAGPDRTGN